MTQQAAPDAAAVLLAPITLNASLTLANRIALAPCTRNRADQGELPTAGAVPHYASRAAAGLLVSEAALIGPGLKGYLDTPGIYSAAHAARWAEVTDAVHQAGGVIFCQLWHPGRLGHSHFIGAPPLAPSAVATRGEARRTCGIPLAHETPRAMSAADIYTALAQYGSAAHFARDAGFDGVEVHGGNGYLPEQFLRRSSNRCDDAWGGTPERRARFVVAAVDACADVFGHARVGLRLSPAGDFGNIERTPGDEEAYIAAIKAMGTRPIAYLHSGIVLDREFDFLGGLPSAFLRRHYRGTLIGNGGYDPASAAAAIHAGQFDMIAFGKLFMANRQLVETIRQGGTLARYQRELLEQYRGP